MFDWLDGFFESVSEDVQYITSYLDDIAGGIDNLIDNLNSYIEFSTYYIWVSGIVLGVLFIMLCVVLNNQKKLKEQNESILKKLETLEPKGEKKNAEYDERGIESDHSRG